MVNVEELIERQEKGAEILERIKVLQNDSAHCENRESYPVGPWDFADYYRKKKELKTYAADALFQRYQKIMRS